MGLGLRPEELSYATVKSFRKCRDIVSGITNKFQKPETKSLKLTDLVDRFHSFCLRCGLGS